MEEFLDTRAKLFECDEGKDSLIDVVLAFKERCITLLKKDDDRNKEEEDDSGSSNKCLKSE